MAIYSVNKGKHGWNAIAVSSFNDAIHCYGLAIRGNNSDGHKVITIEDLLSTDYEFFGEYVQINGIYYEIVGCKSLDRSENVNPVGGSTWVVAQEHDHTVIVNLDTEMKDYSNISEWRYMKHHQLRPMLKIHVHTTGEDLTQTDRVYYHNNNNDCFFITNDEVPPKPVNDESISLLPKCEVRQDENRIIINVRYANGLAPNGMIHFANAQGLACTCVPLVNGTAYIPLSYCIGNPLADILFNYSKIGEL